MAGKATVPVVMVGRYTTFAGDTEFTTIPINVVDYDQIELYVWRGPMIATGSFSFQLEASLDQQTWTAYAPIDPGANTEQTYTVASLKFPWLRARISVGDSGSDFPTVTCYVVGQLIRRLLG